MGVRYVSKLRVSLRATCALLVCILLPSPTRADEAQNTALARSLFEEGVIASDAGDWKRAIERFSRAYALRPSPGIAFNLAGAELEVGQVVRAAEHLRAVTGAADAPTELRERARVRLKEIAPRIAYVIVHVEAPSEDFELRIDGLSMPKQAWGAATPVDPGQRVFDLVQHGEVHDSQTLSILAGERTQLTLNARAGAPPAANAVQVVPPPSPAPEQAPQERAVASAAPADEARPSNKRWVWWTSLGVAVAAGVTVGVVLGMGDGESEAAQPVMGNTSEGVIRW